MRKIVVVENETTQTNDSSGNSIDTTSSIDENGVKSNKSKGGRYEKSPHSSKVNVNTLKLGKGNITLIALISEVIHVVGDNIECIINFIANLFM